MAFKYVYSGAAGAASGADWDNAYTTLGAATPTGSLANQILIASDHVESAGAVAITESFTADAVGHVVIRSGTDWTESEGLGTGAIVRNTGNNAITLECTTNNSGYLRGITWHSSSTGGSNFSTNINVFRTANIAMGTWVLDTCTFILGTAGSSFVQLGPSGGSGSMKGVNLLLKDCTFTPYNATATLNTGAFAFAQAKVVVDNLTISMPANHCGALFGVDNIFSVVDATIKNSDLSTYNTAGKVLFSNTNFAQGKVTFLNCKLGGTSTFQSGTPANLAELRVINCDSASGAAPRNELYTRLGTMTLNGSHYLNSAGAVSIQGSNLSVKVVTTASANEAAPFVTGPHYVYCNTPDQSVTVNMLVAQANGATPFTNRTLYATVNFVDDDNYPLGGSAANGASNRSSIPFIGTDTGTTNRDWTDLNSQTWANLTTPVVQTLPLTFTPEQAGLFEIYLYWGRASATAYAHPAPLVDGAVPNRVVLVQNGGLYSEPAASSGNNVAIPIGGRLAQV